MARAFRSRKRMAVADRPNRALEEALGWEFRDSELLERALTHRSYCAEHAGALSNERLEFFGDAVLGLVVTDYVFREYEMFPEGDLAKLRASVVNSEALADVAAEIGVGEALRLGKGEDAAGGRSKPSILGDAMEAVIAAVYLDAGWEPARALVLRLVEPRIVDGATGPEGQDPKGRLQELLAQRGQVPRYQVRREGPDHAPRFFAVVVSGTRELGDGQGRSKRQAEQMAAQAAWRRLVAVGKDEENATSGVEEPASTEGQDAGAA
ncbi:MAG TPA: ribonuclease III [Acidimicrobiia bacterium]|nr:ribonuclease III [Acidimicrobiia bacterium]